MPLFIAVSDVFGRRPLLVFALVLFTVGAIVCGVAQNFTVLLAGRTVQGSGVGGIMTITEAIITDLVPLRERGNFFALISIVWAIGTIAGKLSSRSSGLLPRNYPDMTSQDQLSVVPWHKITNGVGFST